MPKVSYTPIELCIPIIVCLTIGCLRSVLGYAYDTAQKNNCGACHSMRKSKVKPGTWAIRKDIIRDPVGDLRYDKWSCEMCHTDKTVEFSRVDTTVNGFSKYPSAHPVPVKGRSEDELRKDGKKVMYCTNCHDVSQVDRGVHSTYVTIFRLRSRGNQLIYGDPDPVDDTISIGSDLTSWFWENPFYNVDKGFLRFGKIAHSPEEFNPKNARAGREAADFYDLGADRRQPQLGTIYFCVTCHDDNGFPSDPMDNTSDKICPPNMVDSYNASDGDKNTWELSDGGHVIRCKDGTVSGLFLGDRLPCVECHDSHSSENNRKLIRDSLRGISTGWKVDSSKLISNSFCEKCHENTSSNRYHPGGGFKGYNNVDLKMMPDSHVGKPLYDENSCYGRTSKTGCHKDPHMPVVSSCSGCHQKQMEVYGTLTVKKKQHPVGISLTGTVLSYYKTYADSVEVPLFDDKIECLTCHNSHSRGDEPIFAPHMQGLLRGDSGPLVEADTNSVKLGIGNDYPGHKETHQYKNKFWDSFRVNLDSISAMPELCLNCHCRAIGVDNNHGGFSDGGFGMCDKCHSMHGQHPEPAKGALMNSTNVMRPLHYGMYLKLEEIETAYVSGFEYEANGIEVFKDATGKMFSYSQNEYLIHNKLQGELCEDCHGNSNWPAIVNTTATQPPPPQVFYDPGQTMADKVDTYYTSSVFSHGTRNKSTHSVDKVGIEVPGDDAANSVIDLRCSSGPKGSGCHNPHGNNNFAQLNAMCEKSDSVANVLYTGVGTEAKYVSGMHTFCNLCHDRFGCKFRDDSSNYTRHPAGPGISMLNLYPVASERLQVNSTFFDGLILDYDMSVYSSGRPTRSKFVDAEPDKAAKNFIVTCTTCHRQHGSPEANLRRFSDEGVIECVGCHGKSPDILK